MDGDPELLAALKRIVDVANRYEEQQGPLTPLGERVRAHLGVDPITLPVVAEPVPQHRIVDLDLALTELGAGGALLGVRGGNRQHEEFAAMLANGWARYEPGAVDHALVPSGPHERRRVVAFGLRLLVFEGEPVAVLQRVANRQVGREQALVEVLAADGVGERLLAAARRLMHERSVLRGQVLTLVASGGFGEDGESVFVEREPVAEDDVVLAPGVLPTVRRHVLGIAEHRDALLGAGQHLKRGVLLYGPPGTGKTLTVRHLIGAAEGVTVVLLTGPAIRYIGEATDLARGLQPAMVVLEDIDLVAMDRGHFGPQPLLFAVLDALDGIDGDADVTFLMTTNRVDVLEEALAQRPGRVDLAVEIPRPDAAARRRLFALYAARLPLSPHAVERAADRAAGTTASFAKELMRRVVLAAAIEARPAEDADLATALDEMLAAGAELTRSLLGVEREESESEPAVRGAGWSADAPLPGRSARFDE
ncbi:AAA family ATPase [Amnibacterium endophyticum]|uniref:AAA family ATPase n=1 Tax=Amnibacterium endophyticum TaxID=2109337 RepID=A0ABW4LHE2_9MICO